MAEEIPENLPEGAFALVDCRATFESPWVIATILIWSALLCAVAYRLAMRNARSPVSAASFRQFAPLVLLSLMTPLAMPLITMTMTTSAEIAKNCLWPDHFASSISYAYEDVSLLILPPVAGLLCALVSHRIMKNTTNRTCRPDPIVPAVNQKREDG